MPLSWRVVRPNRSSSTRDTPSVEDSQNYKALTDATSSIFVGNSHFNVESTLLMSFWINEGSPKYQSSSMSETSIDGQNGWDVFEVEVLGGSLALKFEPWKLDGECLSNVVKSSTFAKESEVASHDCWSDASTFLDGVRCEISYFYEKGMSIKKPKEFNTYKMLKKCFASYKCTFVFYSL